MSLSLPTLARGHSGGLCCNIIEGGSSHISPTVTESSSSGSGSLTAAENSDALSRVDSVWDMKMHV